MDLSEEKMPHSRDALSVAFFSDERELTFDADAVVCQETDASESGALTKGSDEEKQSLPREVYFYQQVVLNPVLLGWPGFYVDDRSLKVL